MLRVSPPYHHTLDTIPETVENESRSNTEAALSSSFAALDEATSKINELTNAAFTGALSADTKVPSSKTIAQEDLHYYSIAATYADNNNLDAVRDVITRVHDQSMQKLIAMFLQNSGIKKRTISLAPIDKLAIDSARAALSMALNNAKKISANSRPPLETAKNLWLLKMSLKALITSS